MTPTSGSVLLGTAIVAYVLGLATPAIVRNLAAERDPQAIASVYRCHVTGHSFDVSASIKALDYQPADVAGANTVAVSLTFRPSQSVWDYMTTREGAEELAATMGLPKRDR